MRMTSLAVLGFALSILTPQIANAKTTFEFTDLNVVASDRVTVFVGTDGALSPSAKAIDAMTDGRLVTALKDADFEGKFGNKLHLYSLGGFKTVTVIGMGDEALSTRQLRDLGGYVAQASDNKQSLKVFIDGLETDSQDTGAQLAMGYALSSYTFDRYKTDKKNVDRTVTFLSKDAAASKALYAADLSHMVKGVNFARDIGTEPGLNMYPEEFGERVKTLFRGVGNTRVRVMDVPELRRNNMGALIGVGQGSSRGPRLVMVSYTGADSNEDPIALVGKGITFDTGGISIKPNTGQWLMKSDLSGAAAVAGAVYAAAQRGAKVNLVGYMAMAENMPSGDAIRPGDVLETSSGKTIEVMSTDAEGRLVLSDAVTYAQKQHNPSLLIDIATLTGSAARAMGDDYGVVITRDWDLSVEMMDIGREAGEDVWPLPLNENHFKAIKSDIADIKSTAGSPGASIGGAVIGTFIDEDQPWVHLDIAGVDWLDKSTPTTPKGHAGWGVRFMDAVVRDRAGE